MQAKVVYVKCQDVAKMFRCTPHIAMCVCSAIEYYVRLCRS